MKRGAEAMDGGDSARSERGGNRQWKPTEDSHKRVRHAEGGRGRDASARVQSATVKTLADEKEEDPHRLAQRQKQLDFGKNTIGYDRYCAQVPRHKRRSGRHPMTPDKTKRVGKKVFDGMVRKWRQALHQYDPPELVEATKTENAVAVEPVRADNAAATDGKVGASAQGAVVAVTTSTTELKVNVKEAATTSLKGVVSSELAPPSRSIYENFDEDNFEDEDSDDDLL